MVQYVPVNLFKTTLCFDTKSCCWCFLCFKLIFRHQLGCQSLQQLLVESAWKHLVAKANLLGKSYRQSTKNKNFLLSRDSLDKREFLFFSEEMKSFLFFKAAVGTSIFHDRKWFKPLTRLTAYIADAFKCKTLNETSSSASPISLATMLASMLLLSLAFAVLHLCNGRGDLKSFCSSLPLLLRWKLLKKNFAVRLSRKLVLGHKVFYLVIFGSELVVLSF